MKKYSTEADQGGLMAVRIRFCDLRLAVRLLLRRGRRKMQDSAANPGQGRVREQS